MRGGRWGWAAGLAFAAGATGCDDVDPPARGFHSRQLLSSRDPMLGLVGFGTKILTGMSEDGPFSYPGTDPSLAYYSTGGPPGTPGLTYWEMNLTDNTVTKRGEQIPHPQPPGPPERFDCRREVTETPGVFTLFVDDVETGQNLASIDRVVGIGACPRYPDGYLAIVRLDENGVGRLWSGPFDRLARAELDLAINGPATSNWSYEDDPTKWRMTALAAAGPQPAGLGIYDIDLAQMTAATVIPPVLADVTWAPGAASSGAVGSSGLAPHAITTVYAPGGSPSYVYRRQMDDGSHVMFAGPLALPSSRELALFAPAGNTTSVLFLNATGAGTLANNATWQQTDIPGSDTELLLVWDATQRRVTSCPFARGTLPLKTSPGSSSVMGLVSPDRNRFAFAMSDALRSTGALPGAYAVTSPLIEVSIAGAGSCALLARKDVSVVAIADEAVAWVESAPGGGAETLWVAGAPGDAPRALGSMTILEAPTFIAPHTLQVQLGTDLAWLDVRDDPVKLHYVAEHVFGTPSTGPRWLVTGYGRSSQDGTGTLGVVDWQTGDKHRISPAVLDFIVSSRNSSTRPLNIVYQVRGRSASSQDGIWAATIEASDLP
jgi:hypothetical protein